MASATSILWNSILPTAIKSGFENKEVYNRIFIGYWGWSMYLTLRADKNNGNCAERIQFMYLNADNNIVWRDKVRPRLRLKMPP